MPDLPTAITLDAGGVLLLPDPAATCEALAAFDAEPDGDTYWRVHYEMIRRIDKGNLDYVALSQLMAARLGVPPDLCEAAGPVVSETFLGDRRVAEPGAREALRRLETNGHQLAVIPTASTATSKPSSVRPASAPASRPSSTPLSSESRNPIPASSSWPWPRSGQPRTDAHTSATHSTPTSTPPSKPA